ncbi:hypothetical protein PPL_01754 [Heterostelium album PN500]|uniref:Uncharacterized protein n=1 Tax=Heterostelium pallidum (strain ATCC 26659 / Pp 5 / PN500) TaxID=670386 RepID=D3B0D8_HETP5|nr:hypothetical protein PPL_01754 [Heterostelium album PN500]EFA84762.1 hypothetical protein PPL_01754 [Heterostelium album PN500]|eukprot:XP_020436874.1 hypothetical protein PPL_01754 [Heterostelium album PN500]
MDKQQKKSNLDNKQGEVEKNEGYGIPEMRQDHELYENANLHEKFDLKKGDLK